MPTKTIKVDDVLLDHDNPRISRSASQREALQKILDDQGAKLAALAQSIVQNGLSPMDRFLVIKADKGKWTVIEGNRRLAAVKILTNPAVLVDLDIPDVLQRRFENVAKGYDHSIKSLDCFEMADRTDGALWIRQRHTGENDGRGIVGWTGIATQRFRGADPALQALDFVLAHGGLTDEEKEDIEKRFPITTLDRLLSTPDVRKAIGLSITGGKLQSALPPDEVIKPLLRIVRDLANETVRVTQLKLKVQQVAWVGKLGKDLPDLTKASGAAKPVESIDQTDFTPAPAPAPVPPVKPKAKAKVSVRKSLIPRECVLAPSNAKIGEIVKELRSLSLVDHPHAISVLFRVFLEQSVDHYLTQAKISLSKPKPGGGTNFKTLKEKVQETMDALVKTGIPKKDFSGLSKAINDINNPLSVETLNNYVHNRFYSPTERELTVSWDNTVLFFQKIWP